MSTGRGTSDGRLDQGHRPALMLALATVGFAINFWAWALLSPLGAAVQGRCSPCPRSQQALLVAVPVLVGSLGRIPVGALTDRFGGRVMFPLVSLATIVPVLFIGLAGPGLLAALLVGGFFLGIGGTAFAVGVPFVNAWFPPERRGLAVGVFGAGMGGTAISALTTVKLVDGTGHGGALRHHRRRARLLRRRGLAVAAGRARPRRADRVAGHAAGSAARLPITWQACILYAVAFGGYVAFSVYLPAYLKTAYGLDAGGRRQPDGRLRRSSPC